MSGGGAGLYRRGGASDSTNLDATFIVSELLHSTTKRLSRRTARHVTSGHTHAPPVRPRHATPSARRGKRARAVVHRPSLTGFTSGVHSVRSHDKV